MHPLRSLRPAVASLAPDGTLAAALAAASERGHFRPAEDQLLIGWFARFLTVRCALWEVIDEAAARLGSSLRLRDDDDRRAFLGGYAAACLVVRLDRLLVEELALDSIVQRKLNEGDPARRVPRKQFTAIWESLADARGAWLLQRAMRVARRHRRRLAALSEDPDVGFLVRDLAELERSLDPSRRRFFRRVAGFLAHALRRRVASTRQQALFTVLESSGTFVSELRDPWHTRRIDARKRSELAGLLRPGDVLVTRRERVATNLFLPGYWPHAALYVGDADDRDRLAVEVDAGREQRWSGDRCVLEALKDGVLFRPLAETLDVDAVAVLRPRLAEERIAQAIELAAAHEGKGYNFDFDFFRSDRLVCSEVVYRAYDGLDGMSFDLRERAGRPTLSAEDLIEPALDGRLFEIVAVCGAPGCEDAVVRGPQAAELVRSTLVTTP